MDAPVLADLLENIMNAVSFGKLHLGFLENPAVRGDKLFLAFGKVFHVI